MEDLQTKNIFYIYGNFFKAIIIPFIYLISKIISFKNYKNPRSIINKFLISTIIINRI